MLRARQTKVFHPRHMDQLFIISTFWAVRKPNKTNQNICLELLEFRWEILELFAFSDAAVLSDKWFFPICLRLWIIHGISFYHAYNIFSATTTTGGLVIFFLRFSPRTELCMDYICELCPYLNRGLLKNVPQVEEHRTRIYIRASILYVNCVYAAWAQLMDISFGSS